MPYLDACPACHSTRLETFYEVRQVPANSCLMVESRDEAIAFPRGDIALAWCKDCDFITNRAFDPALTEYSSRYEETQAFSPTFNAFHQVLAERLIERHALRGKTVVEIGCGKGEFLTLLCERGGNRGVGFDPGYREERNQSPAAGRMTFINDFFSRDVAPFPSDLLCCKMTLEHIPQVSDFIATVRLWVDGGQDPVIFFQVPETGQILQDLAFWDIYYEHCSYFTPGSLARLFARRGFRITEIGIDYGGQYLMIEARPHNGVAPAEPPGEIDDPDATGRLAARFGEGVRSVIERWKRRLGEFAAAGERTVLWGSGSKGVALLTTLGITSEVEYVVDINPYRHGKFMLGTGQEIIGPEFLKQYRPDRVVIMNPVYRDEISRMLVRMDLHPNILTV